MRGKSGEGKPGRFLAISLRSLAIRTNHDRRYSGKKQPLKTKKPAQGGSAFSSYFVSQQVANKLRHRIHKYKINFPKKQELF